MILQDSSKESPLGFWLVEAVQMPQASHATMCPAFVPSLRPTFRTYLAGFQGPTLDSFKGGLLDSSTLSHRR